MAGDIKAKYGSSSAFTVTALHSLATSSGLDAGWTSAGVDSAASDILDWHVAATFSTAATNRQAGLINVWAYAGMDSTPTWPDLFSSGTEGSEGAATCTDSEHRDAGMVLLASIIVDTGASDVMSMRLRGLKSYFESDIPPEDWALFVTTNATSTGSALAASGSAVYRKPVLAQYT